MKKLTKERKALLFKEYNIIKKEEPYIDIKPYSHNIISITLMKINKDFGKKYANIAIKKYNLENKGWKIVK